MSGPPDWLGVAAHMRAGEWTGRPVCQFERGGRVYSHVVFLSTPETLLCSSCGHAVCIFHLADVDDPRCSWCRTLGLHDARVWVDDWVPGPANRDPGPAGQTSCPPK